MLIYKQVVNKLFSIKLEQVGESNIFINDSPVTRKYAVTLLCQYFQELAEIAFSSVSENRTIDFLNSVIKYIAVNFNLCNSNVNLADYGNIILSAFISETPSHMEKYLKSVNPISSYGISPLLTKLHVPTFYTEMLCSDRIDLVIASKDVSLIYSSLMEFKSRGKQIRIISDKLCFHDSMIRLSSDVPISNNILLIRKSGFHIAYFGLSKRYCTKSISWNLRATQYDNPDIISSFSNSFSSFFEKE